MSLNTTPATYTSGQTLTAAIMNAQVRDAISGLQAAWSDTATTWTAATTNPTLGNGVLTNRVNRTGKSIAVNLTLVFGSTTTIGSGAYTFTLPVASVFSTTTYVNLGSASMRDTSASANRIGAAILTSPSTFQIVAADGTTVGSAAPWTWANNDILSINLEYEAA